jgi:hypothetical protein
MTRTLLILVPTVLGVSLGAAAFAQNAPSSSTKCGPETWSTDKMAYVGVPCTGQEAAQPTSSNGQTAKAPAAAKCGVETWSTDKMTYVTTPCTSTEQ